MFSPSVANGSKITLRSSSNVTFGSEFRQRTLRVFTDVRRETTECMIILKYLIILEKTDEINSPEQSVVSVENSKSEPNVTRNMILTARHLCSKPFRYDNMLYVFGCGPRLFVIESPKLFDILTA